MPELFNILKTIIQKFTGYYTKDEIDTSISTSELTINDIDYSMTQEEYAQLADMIESSAGTLTTFNREVHELTINTTTSTNGNINTTLTVTDNAILSAHIINSDCICIPCCYNGCWSFHLMTFTSSHSAIAETAVSAVIRYIPLSEEV